MSMVACQIVHMVCIVHTMHVIFSEREKSETKREGEKGRGRQRTKTTEYMNTKGDHEPTMQKEKSKEKKRKIIEMLRSEI